jgi:hypothetical protein
MANMEMMIATFLEDAYTNPQNSIRIKTNSFGLWLMKGMQISMNSCEKH